MESFFEKSNNLFCILDASDLKFKTINCKAWESTLKWKKEEIIGKSFIEFLHPDGRHSKDDNSGEVPVVGEVDAILIKDLRKAMIVPPKGCNLLKQFRAKDDTYCWILWTTTYVEDEGKFLFTGHLHDKPAEVAEHYPINKARILKDTLDIAKIGQWDYENATDTLSWSPIVYELFEVDPAKFGATYEAFLGGVHPDDVAKVDAAWQRHLKTKEPYQINHRLLVNGKVKYVQENCRTEFNEDGTPSWTIGTVQDTTGLKLEED